MDTAGGCGAWARSGVAVAALLAVAACADGAGPATTDVPSTAACTTAADCADLAPGECEQAVCVSGACAKTSANEGGTCGAGDSCATAPKTCVNGACEYNGTKDCPALACQAAAGCNALTGECLYAPGPDGDPCDLDGSACTDDRCLGGTCQAGANGCLCQEDTNCPQPADRCRPLKCDTGSGTCVAAPVACAAAADPCSPATCDPTTGTCGATPVADGTACGNGDPCRDGWTCLAGTCQGPDPCDDGNACTESHCTSPAGTRQCDQRPLTGTSCDDRDACTEGDACTAQGTCAGSPKPCDDGNPCTVDSCVPATGCHYEPAPAGTVCDDHDACTTADACASDGTCAGTPTVCDDANDCTTDSCDPATGTCQFSPRDGSCDDGEVCTGGDHCQAGTCAGTPIPNCCHADADCDDGDACTAEHCGTGNRCSFDGETPSKCTTNPGCSRAACDASSGSCDPFDSSRPRVVLDWDLTPGTRPAGFVWTLDGGTLAEGGVRATGTQGTGFRLPGHVLPAGVKVLHVTLAAGDACEAVSVTVHGAAPATSGCGAEDGLPVLGVAWSDEGNTQTEVTVGVASGATVQAVRLFVWATTGCQPLAWQAGETASPGPAVSMVGGALASTVLFREPLNLVVVADSFAGVDGGATVHPNLDGSAMTAFRTTLVPIGGSSFLAAYGGYGSRVNVAIVDTAALTAVESPLPQAATGEAQTEPVLARTAAGGFRLFYTSSAIDPDGSGGVALVDLDVAGGQVSFGTAAGVATGAGQQHAPAAWLGPQGGLLAFLSDDSTGRSVNLASLDGDGNPGSGQPLQVESSATSAFESLSLAGTGQMTLAWSRDGLQIEGASVPLDLSSRTALAPATGLLAGTSPTVWAGPAGTILAWVQADQTAYDLVIAAVDDSGAVGSPAVVAPGIDPTLVSPVGDRCGPFVSCVGWVETVAGAGPVLRMALASPGCAQGPVSCADNTQPQVCVGFGTMYVAQAGATGWCP